MSEKLDSKTLADVQPGGRVRLGGKIERARFEAWAKDRGHDLSVTHGHPIFIDGVYEDSDTYAAWVVWQAALSAQPSQGGQAAHCPVKHCGMTYARVPADGRCHACGATVQPSPGGQGDELPALPYPNYPISKTGLQNNLYTASQMQDYARAALAARQPVGEPVAWMTHHDEPMLFPTAAEAAAYCEDDEQPVPLFRPPTQAVDLGAVREAVRKAWQKCAAGESVDLQFGTLLALIDSHGASNG